MLVQEVDDSLRLIRQQDHAQLSGALAHAWRVPTETELGDQSAADRSDDGTSLPYRVVWATGVHDAAWTGLDRRPILDPETGRPCDFHRLPLSRKLEPYRRGIERIADLDSYAGFQVSRHYGSFLDVNSGGDEVEAFLEAERRRREGLRERLPPPLRGDALLDRELAWLKLFDTLSLYLCLTGPDVETTARPGWLVPEDRVETPAGRTLGVGWRSRRELVLEPEGGPAPLASDLELRIPYREVPAMHGSQEELEESWREAGTEHLEVRVRGER